MRARHPLWDRTVAGPHKVLTKVELLVEGQVAATSVDTSPNTTRLPQPVDGEVSESRSSATRGTLDVTLASQVVDRLQSTGATIDKNGQELRVWRGAVLPDLTPAFVCLGTFGIQDVNDTVPYPALQVSGLDRGNRLAEVKFLEPRYFPPEPAITRLRRLVVEASPYSELVVADGVVDAQVPELTESQDRQRVCLELAALLGAELWPTSYGDFLLRPIPDGNDTADVTMRTGRGGQIVTARGTRSRGSTYNAIVVEGQSTDGVLPRAVAKDLDPLSPTKWNEDNTGFGQKPGFWRTGQITASDQADVAARGQLLDARGEARTISLTVLCNAAYQPSDVWRVELSPTRAEQHVVDQLRTPIGALGGQQTGSSRVVRAGGLS